MSQESVRDHLRAALAAVTSGEKIRLNAAHSKLDADQARRAERLRPVFAALRILAEEVDGVTGVAIRLAEQGHIATLYLEAAGSSHSFSISVPSTSDRFRVQETKDCSFMDEYVKDVHEFAEAERALELVVTAVGKHVAQSAAVKERLK